MAYDDKLYLKIPCFYIMMNNKMKKSIIINDDNNIDINIESIYSYFEEGLFNLH